MAASVKTRIQLKCDTEEHWGRALNFIPLFGELIIYSADDAHPFFRLKVGDGVTNVVELPFIRAESMGGEIVNHTTAYWEEHYDYVPKDGEIISYSDRQITAQGNLPGLKIGDGETTVANLLFIDALVQQHLQNTTIHVTSQEKTFWNTRTFSGTESEWTLNPTFLPPEGSIVIYTDTSSIKTGDGIHTVSELPYISAGTVTKLKHTLTFGADQAYTFDGSKDVTVPVYMGVTT